MDHQPISLSPSESNPNTIQALEGVSNHVRITDSNGAGDSTTITSSLAPAPAIQPPLDEPNPWVQQQQESPSLSSVVVECGKVEVLPGTSADNPVDLNEDPGLGGRDDVTSINGKVPLEAATGTQDGGIDGTLLDGGEEEEKERKKQEVLDEFDPLVIQEEKAAWESVESHPSYPPPPPSNNKENQELIQSSSVTSEGTLAESKTLDLQAKEVDGESNLPSTPSQPAQPQIPPPPSSTTQQQQQQPQQQQTPPSPKPTFPALAALAKTFSLPLGNRIRPRSLDLAASVPSPATLSSFAIQQQLPPSVSGTGSPERVSTPSGFANGPAAAVVVTGSGSGSDVATPGRSSRPSSREAVQDGAVDNAGGGGGATPSFDFQKFLDQMKLKGADPVAKYLRSYVSPLCSNDFYC